MFNSKRSFSVAAMFFIVALVVAACAPAASAPTALPLSTLAPSTEVDTQTPEATPPEATPEAMTPESTPEGITPDEMPLIPNTGATSASPSTSQTPMVGVALNPTLGSILTDGNGMTIYAFTNDTAGVSNCTGQCATFWPPFTLAQGATPAAGAGMFGTLGTIQRADGTTQVTVNNMPVYYFAKDTKAGDTNGQGVANSWYVLDAGGTLLKGTMMGAAPAPVPTPVPTVDATEMVPYTP